MSEQPNNSRREFLKTSIVAGAGAALAASLNPRMAHAAGDETIRVGLVGCGGRGTGAVSQLMNADKNLKLLAVADAFEKKADATLKTLRNKYGGQVAVPDEQKFVGLTGFMDLVKTDIDLVVIATPPGFRPIQYKAAIDANKNVFMEKPCCVDAPGYLSLMKTNALADEKGLLVGVGLQRRHQPNYMETIQRIQDGAIGDLTFLRAYWNGGGIWNRAREADMTEMQYQVHNWYHFCWLSGDNISEQHIHNIDVCNWVKDGHPVEANGMGGCTARYLGDLKGTGQIFDHHFVEFTYADGTKMYSQCRHMRNTFTNVSEAAHGTKGTSNCAGRIDGQDEWRFDGKNVNGHQQEQTDLVAAMRAGKRYNEGYYGADSSFTSALGRIANYSGQVVKWDEALKEGTSEFPQDLSWDAPAPVNKDDNGDYPIPMPGVTDPYKLG